jgi:hypothetical protein
VEQAQRDCAQTEQLAQSAQLDAQKAQRDFQQVRGQIRQLQRM